MKVILNDKSYANVLLGRLVHPHQQYVGAQRIVLNVEYRWTIQCTDITIAIEAALDAWMLSTPLFICTLTVEAAA